MNLSRDFLRQYWPNLAAILVFLAALGRYAHLAAWEQRLVPFAAAVLGLVCVLASEEVVDWTGRYGWTREQFRVLPSDFVRFAGGVALVAATAVLYLS